MKSRLAENSEKKSVDIMLKRNSADITNELNFSKSHKFDFIKSETLGGLKNIQKSNQHSKNEIMVR
jgi:hypothetical protein